MRLDDNKPALRLSGPSPIVGLRRSVVGPRPRAWAWPLALGGLVALTSVTLAIFASGWLVLPYLVLMAWVLGVPRSLRLRAKFLIGRRHDPSHVSGRPGRRAGPQPPDDPEGPEPLDSDADDEVDVDIEGDSGPFGSFTPSGADFGGARPRRSRGRGRKAKTASLADPAEATWVRIGPGKFVRADAPEAPTVPSDAPVPPVEAEGHAPDAETTPEVPTTSRAEGGIVDDSRDAETAASTDQADGPEEASPDEPWIEEVAEANGEETDCRNADEGEAILILDSDDHDGGPDDGPDGPGEGPTDEEDHGIAPEASEIAEPAPWIDQPAEDGPPERIIGNEERNVLALESGANLVSEPFSEVTLVDFEPLARSEPEGPGPPADGTVVAAPTESSSEVGTIPQPFASRRRFGGSRSGRTWGLTRAFSSPSIRSRDDVRGGCGLGRARPGLRSPAPGRRFPRHSRRFHSSHRTHPPRSPPRRACRP